MGTCPYSSFSLEWVNKEVTNPQWLMSYSPQKETPIVTPRFRQRRLYVFGTFGKSSKCDSIVIHYDIFSLEVDTSKVALPALHSLSC